MIVVARRRTRFRRTGEAAIQRPRRHRLPLKSTAAEAEQLELTLTDGDAGTPIWRPKARGERQWHLPLQWSWCLNLPSRDLLQSYAVMQATAAQNVRCRRPVYHLAGFLAAEDQKKIGLPEVHEICERLLTGLDMYDNQSVLLVPLPVRCWRFHLIVNLVNPFSTAVAPTRNDYATISRISEEVEAAYGLVKSDTRIYNNLLRVKGAPVRYDVAGRKNVAWDEAAIIQCFDKLAELAEEEKIPELETEYIWPDLVHMAGHWGLRIFVDQDRIVFTNPATNAKGRLDTSHRAYVFVSEKYRLMRNALQQSREQDF